MSEIKAAMSPDTLLSAGVQLLTPPIRELYALLVRAGVLVIDD
ncbi:Rv1535 domain-containing protein [Mycolicibacterium brumae]|nr:Rv1535 domain-containing protein [Mycolicibacterium brumae]RWA16700.1 hypothetical protein MBRU_08215 [Mycolicibacterium brumae DSM 44177]UWW09919.1 Rv1535 domain-containing protein [Mycolicibacterium brumae]